MIYEHVACTSFSPDGYEKYGRRFIETFLENWEIPLIVFYEGAKPNIVHDRVEYVDLLDDRDNAAFEREWGKLPAAHGITHKEGDDYLANYRFQAMKFARKVFALTKFPLNCDWWIWIDADVETFAPVDKAFLNEACPPNALISYLAREEWDHSECGFVGYRVGHPIGRAVLKELRRMYSSGEVFHLREWHDSYVFDRVLETFAPEWQNRFVSLSKGVPGNHVWPDTVLGRVMTHNKGPELKQKAYGT